VSLSLTLRHNGTGGGVTAIMQALTQQGIEPVPSRRTLYCKQNLQKFEAETADQVNRLIVIFEPWKQTFPPQIIQVLLVFYAAMARR